MKFVNRFLLLWIQFSYFHTKVFGQDCYSLGCSGRRHFTYREYRQVNTVQQCFDECRSSRMCKTFSYKKRDYYSQAKNCLLSDETSDADTMQDLDWDIYTMKNCANTYVNNDYNNQVSSTSCHKLYATKSRIDLGRVASSIRTNTIEECKGRCKNGCLGFSYSHHSTYQNCLLSDRQDFTRYLIRDDDSDVFLNSCRNGRENSYGFYPSNGGNNYAVSGEKCLNGGCRLNQDIGYWYCDIGSTGDWEYCCKPEDRCGYKDGGSSPWCYVGNAGSDQWRPCKINSIVNP